MKPQSMRQQEFEDFYLPFSGKLKSTNRWVLLAKRIPWEEFEGQYSKNFAGSGQAAHTPENKQPRQNGGVNQQFERTAEAFLSSQFIRAHYLIRL